MNLRESKIYGIKYDGKIIYVGRTTQVPQQRLSSHFSHRNNERICPPKLMKHFVGKELRDHTLVILERCSKQDAPNREIYWIKKLNTIEDGCNTSLTQGREKGCKNPTGKDHYLYGKQVARHIVEASIAARRGRHLSPEHRMKISIGNRRKKCVNEINI
jgi:hypothetical protein